jgi:hypothetical protein
MHKTITIALIILFVSSVAEAEQSACDKITSQTENVQSFLNPPSSYKVIGERRAYFYSAPHENCRSKDIFVVTGDDLIAYTEYKGWYSVSYANPKTGKDYDGWVKSERLKRTGSIRPETR